MAERYNELIRKIWEMDEQGEKLTFDIIVLKNTGDQIVFEVSGSSDGSRNVQFTIDLKDEKLEITPVY